SRSSSVRGSDCGVWAARRALDAISSTVTTDAMAWLRCIDVEPNDGIDAGAATAERLLFQRLGGATVLEQRDIGTRCGADGHKLHRVHATLQLWHLDSSLRQDWYCDTIYGRGRDRQVGCLRALN